MKPLESLENVDTERFMGAWYVIAHIPPFLTDDAYNSVERYRLNDDGTVDVLFTYNEGSFDGPLKTMRPKGFPEQGDADGTWGMRFVWPLKSDYRIVYLNDDYTESIVGRNKRDYVWIMAKTPSMPKARLDALTRRVLEMGYDASDLRVVPQQPLSERATPAEAEDF